MTSFSLAVSTLQDLLDPKNPEALCQLGGVGFVAKQLRVDVKTGLTKEDLNRENLSARVNHFGRNVLPEPPSKGFFQLVWEGLQDNTLIMLCISAIISLVLGIRENPSTGWIEGVAIIMAVVIVVLVSAVNDYNKEVQFRKLNAKKNAKDIKVFRDGKQKQVPIDEILVGDIVDIATGDILAADGLFLDGHDIRCDESGATGESDAIKKGPVGTADPFFLSGTQVMEGSGRMMVIAVGEASYNGKTMMSLQVEPQPTPLQEKLEVLAEQIAYVGIVSAGLTFAVLTAKNLYLSGGVVDADFFSAIVRYIITAITMLVVAVPEGLPLAVTMALAYSTTRMLEDNNLVRHLDACETMGGATNICSDKTGTLTENKMTVVEGQVGGRLFDKVDATTGEGWHKSVRNLLLDGIAVNSNAYITTDETGKPLMVGSKTETALLQFGTKLGGDYNALRAELPAVHVYPFSSASKSMSTVVKTRTGDGGPFRFFVKGASEIVLGRCSKYIGVDGVVHDMDENKRESLNNHINDMATDALRTIGLAYADLAAIPADNWDTAPSVPLVLVSLVGIRDPVRKEVPDAVRVCQRAGVKVRMVTGDNLVTARNIAEKCGIYNGGLTMEGPAFRKLPPAELNRIVPQLEVLARSSPTDKQILVRTLIANGEVVAVTGDGTNDGPALKLAHVGFAMGVTGTDVAKEASDIILMDDNFTSIVKAVSWGRNVFSSIRKFLQFQLTVNVAAVVLAFVGSVTSDHGESPLKPVQLLWVNLIMDTLAALALATEDPVPEMLLQKPYGKKESLISPIMWKNIVGQAIYQMIVNFAILYQSERLLGIEEGSVKHLTMFFNTFVMCQLFNEVNSRKINGELNVFAGILKNWLFVVVMLFTLVGQWAIIEYGGDWVGCTPLTNDEWLICIGLGALSIPVSILIRLLPFARATAGSASEDTPVILDKIATVKSRWQKAVKQVQTQRSVVGLFRRSTKSRLQRGYSRDQK